MCDYYASYPNQYVGYYTSEAPVLDGKLDEKLWMDVPFSSDFVDISTDVTPRFSTRMKIRFDEEFLYVGAHLDEPQIWANITHACHCISPEDQVIYHDNDFEIFVDVDGSTHFYKEYEMNAANATWDLILNKPYDDGGYENSTRVLKNGFDMQPPLASGVFINGRINDTRVHNKWWSVEVALPLTQLAVNKTAVIPVPDGEFWRINFSRVEWRVEAIDGRYIKQSGPEDNWVWSPQGAIAMHLPEKWGMLQFSYNQVNTTKPKLNPEWPARAVAASLYYAEHNFKKAHGSYTSNAVNLQHFDDTGLLTCETGGIHIAVSEDGFVASATVRDPKSGNVFTATVTEDRFIQVRPN